MSNFAEAATMTRPNIDHVVQQLSNLHLGHFQTWSTSSRELFGRTTTPDSSSSDDESEVTNEFKPMIVVHPPPSEEEQPSDPRHLLELADQFRIMGLSEVDSDLGTELEKRRGSRTPEEKAPLRSALRRQRRVRKLQ
ncbi:hypothetical protein DL546_002207 [Coniochaeta pulveracea]|uniref:Uncharacterized protein n=1 Tax=Coniochaeta pulveracea TaxID=177199 RepID=A0A420Y7R2_9PEZI|nr:hypothetical protein DL546_002207 [Coniochaeta pulveracea]